MTFVVTGGLGFIGSHFVRGLLEVDSRSGALWRQESAGAAGPHARSLSGPPDPGVPDDAGPGPPDDAGVVPIPRGELHVVNLDRETYAANPSNLSDVADDPRYEHVRADVADPQAVNAVFRRHRPLVVVNFAAESHVDRSILDSVPFVATNVEGTRVLLDAAREYGVGRFVQVSTDEVYGDVAGMVGGCDEDAPFRPSSPYAATKAAADHLCLAYRRTYGLPVVLARPSNNYGPNQHPEKLVPLAVRLLSRGHPVPLYGGGSQERDWMYVEDCVRGLLRVLHAGEPGASYNLATGIRRSNREVVEEIARALRAMDAGPGTVETEEEATGADAAGSPSSGPPEVPGRPAPDRPGHDRRYAPDPDRARRELGWKAEVGFSEGIRRTVRWYLEHPRRVEDALDGEFREYAERVYDSAWEGAG